MQQVRWSLPSRRLRTPTSRSRSGFFGSWVGTLTRAWARELRRYAFDATHAEWRLARGEVDGLCELALLSRVKTGKLSEQRTRTHDQELIRYLNGLCLRAYVHLAPACRAYPDAAGSGSRTSISRLGT